MGEQEIARSMIAQVFGGTGSGTGAGETETTPLLTT